MKSFKETYESYRGKKLDSAVAEKANLHKSTLSRMKNELIPANRNYLWSLALALELTMGETDTLFTAAGLCMASQYHLTAMEKRREEIIKKHIDQQKYDIIRLNIYLYEHGYKLLGNKGIN